ncbi:MAG: hypothetical protein DRQ88_03675 [Epsilonproteobacteria bacterium]|nr:MAG: hypothetical protein DRQ89_03815 [Campylobacterota bacterium]RLA67274.1 MAG: hypothetical protein DRQ88_03675 [Campylobacterota bacterium]
MGRTQSRHIKRNLVPKTVVRSMNYNQMSRRPASIIDINKMVNYSNQTLYFLTLVSQYRQMRAFTHSSVPKIKHCPRFHTEFLNLKETTPLDKKISNLKINIADIKELDEEAFQANHPEVFLPLEEEDIKPTVADKIKEEGLDQATILVKKAIFIHEKKLFSELMELCDRGVSDNYFAYRNLITYTLNYDKNFAPSKKNMEILLKTTLFHNMLLIKSLSNQSVAPARSPASVQKEDHLNEHVYYRLKVDWANDYFKEISP